MPYKIHGEKTTQPNPAKFIIIGIFVVGIFLYTALGSKSKSGYDPEKAKSNFDTYIQNSLEKSESYVCTTWTAPDTLTVAGRKERMAYVEFVYRGEYDTLIPVQTFAYFDIDGNVLRVEQWPPK